MPEFGLKGDIPVSACANCGHQKGLSIVPYYEDKGGPMMAVIILCALCRLALHNKELQCNLDIRVTGQQPYNG